MQMQWTEHLKRFRRGSLTASRRRLSAHGNRLLNGRRRIINNLQMQPSPLIKRCGMIGAGENINSA